MTRTLFESFNARNYTPAQVAEIFIPNEDYQLLWRNEHTVVLGPRGSGKTTLFKMLTIQALYAWHDEIALALRQERPFTAIYIPADMHWHHQLTHVEKLLVDAPQFSDSWSRAAVTTSVLLAIVRTFQDRLVHEVSPDQRKEAELCSTLIAEWVMPRSVRCLDAIILGLKSRISEIRRIVNEAVLRGGGDQAALNLVPDYFHLDYFAALDVACTAFDTIFDLPRSSKWAVCLDELEIAPRWLQQLAFSQLRSTEEKYLIKLSTSPLPSIVGTTHATPKQDVRLICIWNHAGRKTDDFSEKLARSVLKRRLGREIDPKAAFGRSTLVLQAEEGVTKYSKGSAEWELIKELASWDTSLRQILVRSGLNPENPSTRDIGIRNTILRKIKPVAMLRHAFLKPGTSGINLRSRKLGTIYYGREAIYRLSDGNPRRLIGILGDLCAKLQKGTNGLDLPLDPNEQAEVLARTSMHFSGYVQALPGGTARFGEHILDLATLLKAIATFFRHRLLGPEFQLDPVGSFTIDSHLSEKVVDLLRLGVYHGAVVHVDPVPDSIETSLRGKRFRLSYMLAPINKLPLTLYDAVSLSSILSSSSKLRVRRALPGILGQQELRLPLEEE